MSERTLAIIKPDAVKKNAIGDVINRYEQAGLKPVAIKMMHLSKPTAQGFYAVHKARPFFDSLCTLHVVGTGGGPGASGRQCHQEAPRPDGCDGSCEGRQGNDSRGSRCEYRIQRRPRVGFSRDGPV